jgi:hypothetical protein
MTRRRLALARSTEVSASEPSGYSVAARIAQVRASSRYGALATDTSNPMAPNGLELPAEPSWSETILATSIAQFNTAATGNNRRIILQAGTHSGTPLITGRHIEAVFSSATVVPANGDYALRTTLDTRNIKIVEGTFQGGIECAGRDFHAYDIDFQCPGNFEGGAHQHSGIFGGHRILFERSRVRKASNGWFFAGASTDSQFTASCSGTTLTVTDVFGGVMEDGQVLIAASGGNFLPGTYIVDQLTGEPGLEGTYQVNQAQTVSSGNKFGLTRSTNLIMANCDIEVPLKPTLEIVNITRANPAVVTYEGDFDPANGDSVVITGVSGMTQINSDATRTIANVNTGAKTFQVSGVDSSAFSIYTSGGFARATWPTENTQRFNGVDQGLIIDCRLYSEEKHTLRSHANYSTLQSSRNVFWINNQSEHIGILAEEPGGFGVHPATENLVVEKWRLYRGENDNTGGLLVVPYYSKMFNIASVTGNGTNATIEFEWAHGIDDGEPIVVDIVDMANSSFNATGVTLTRVTDLTASYPCLAVGSTAGGAVETTRIVNENFEMWESESFSAPTGGDEGVADEALYPTSFGCSEAPWPVADPEVSLARGNRYRAWQEAPAWAHHETMPT